MDIIDKFIKYFYEKNYTFDEKKEKLFRDQMEFAREHYPRTDEFLESYYIKWCDKEDTFVLPFGVFKTLFQDVWPDLGTLWARGKRLNEDKK